MFYVVQGLSERPPLPFARFTDKVVLLHLLSIVCLSRYDLLCAYLFILFYLFTGLCVFGANRSL